VLARRRRWVIGAAVIVVAIAAVIALIVTTGSSPTRQTAGSTTTSTTSVTGGTPQPHVPAGWTARTVGIAKVAVPDGWRSTKTGVEGITLAVWWPGAPKTGTLPSRCVVQERPQWLLTFLHSPDDWAGALRRDLTTMEAETTQEAGPTTVTDAHPVQVRGALAALVFDAVVSHASTSAEPKLQSSDLLAALPNGTEVHVYCSGASGTLPTNLSEGVESATFGPARS
jgi:hypothetical protein